MELSCAGTALGAIPRQKCDSLLGEKSLWHDSHKPLSLHLLGGRCSAGPLPREPEFCPQTCIS